MNSLVDSTDRNDNIEGQLNPFNPINRRRPWENQQASASITHVVNEFLKRKKRKGWSLLHEWIFQEFAVRARGGV